MSLLRIWCPLPDPPLRCQWALIDGHEEPVTGETEFAQLPRKAERVELVIPASQVLLTRAKLPQASGRRNGTLLAYAVEEEMASEPDINQVSWLGAVDGADILAAVDRKGLENWRTALAAVGIYGYAVRCETLMLPLSSGGWSVAWNGREGFVRTGVLEGAATDCGDRESPPLSLRMMLDDAKANAAAPTSIALYLTTPDAMPDVEAWKQELGVTLLPAKRWDWRIASTEAGVSVVQQERGQWRLPAGTRARLRPVAWIAGIALAIHALASVADWARLAGEQQALRQQMELRFRAAFPDAVAVADPALQMRRKLADARHAVNRLDDGDFPVMIEKVAVALKELPPGSVRTVSYEAGRMTLDLANTQEAQTRRIAAHLIQAGLRVEIAPTAMRVGRHTVSLTVRSS